MPYNKTKQEIFLRVFNTSHLLQNNSKVKEMHKLFIMCKSRRINKIFPIFKIAFK